MDSVPMPDWMRDDLRKHLLKQRINAIKNSTFVREFKNQFEQNPVAVIMAVGTVVVATAKLIDAVGHAKGSRAYAKQVNYRINKNR